jgi:hypothetical protein
MSNGVSFANIKLHNLVGTKLGFILNRGYLSLSNSEYW